MAKKKVVKKKTVPAVKRHKTIEEQAVDEAVDAMTEEEVMDTINASAATQAPKGIEAADHSKEAGDMVRITIPVHLKIKRKVYAPGTHTVPRHMVATMMEMVHKKRKSDLAMFTGKNYLVERLLNRALSVKEVGSLDLKQMAR